MFGVKKKKFPITGGGGQARANPATADYEVEGH